MKKEHIYSVLSILTVIWIILYFRCGFWVATFFVFASFMFIAFIACWVYILLKYHKYMEDEE